MAYEVNSKPLLPLVLLLLWTNLGTNDATTANQHRKFDYKNPADESGSYNFAYDTGTKDAHSMRMEHRDQQGVVRGRYGYTDPHGKLRVVEYEAGPEGFRARGDVGPDKSLHSVAPAPAYTEPDKLTNLQLIGWDPAVSPVKDANTLVYRPPLEPIIHKSDAGKSLEQTAIMVDPQSDTVVAVPVSEDHPVKGYQAPIPIMQKYTEPVFSHREKSIPVVPKPVAVLARSRPDHPVKGDDVPIAVVEEPVRKSLPPPKMVRVAAPVTIDHPVKGQQAPVRIRVPPHPPTPPKPSSVIEHVDYPVKSHDIVQPVIQKSSGIKLGHPVEPLRAPPPPPPHKSVAVLEPLKEHAVKGHDPLPVVQKSEKLPFVRHFDEVGPPTKTSYVPPPVSLNHPVKGFKDTSLAHKTADVLAYESPELHPLSKTLSSVKEYEEHRPSKLYTPPQPLNQKSIDVVEQFRVEDPPILSHVKSAPIMTHKKDVHSQKLAQAPLPIVSKSDRVELEHHVDDISSPPKTVALVAPDHSLKGYRRTEELVHKSVPVDKYGDKVYARPVSKIAHHVHDPPKTLSSRKDTRDHHHHSSDYTSVKGAHRFAETKKHYEEEVQRAYPIVEAKVDSYHKSHKSLGAAAAPLAVKPKESDHKGLRQEHRGFDAVPVVVSKGVHGYKKKHPVAVIDRHSSVTATTKDGKILDHYHQRNEPLTIYNIDVDPDEIRVAAPPAPHHHHTSNRQQSSTRVATDVSVGSPDVILREYSAPRSVVSRSASVSSSSRTAESFYGSHNSRPRRVVYRPGRGYVPGAFVWER